MEKNTLQDFTTKELLQELKRREVYQIDRVIDVVCEHFNVTREDVKGKKKKQIPIYIDRRTTVYVDCESKIEEVRNKYLIINQSKIGNNLNLK